MVQSLRLFFAPALLASERFSSSRRRLAFCSTVSSGCGGSGGEADLAGVSRDIESGFESDDPSSFAAGVGEGEGDGDAVASESWSFAACLDWDFESADFGVV